MSLKRAKETRVVEGGGGGEIKCYLDEEMGVWVVRGGQFSQGDLLEITANTYK